MTQLEQCPTCGALLVAGQAVCAQCGSNLAQAAQIAALAERVAVLERLVQDAARSGGKTAVSPPTTSARAAETAVSPPPKTFLPEEMWQSDFWLNKVGIGLLLLALAFLFNYAIDQGWLTPAVRVGIGLLLGTFLLVMAYRLRPKRPQFSQVLAGGGIAAYYISGFAAFQLYELIPYTAAFVFMCLVTLLALLLALRQQAVMLALIGGAGGLATPFLINSGSGNVIALISYSLILTSGLVLIYVWQGWLLVQWLANLGGWLIIITAMIVEDVGQLSRATSEGTAVQVAIVVSLLIFWLVPTGRKLLLAHQPDKLPAARLWAGESGPNLRRWLDWHPSPAIFWNGLAGWLLTLVLWSLEQPTQGWVTLTTAVFFLLLALVVTRAFAHASLAYSHGVTAAFLLTIALLLLLEDDWLLLALAAEAALLHLATRWVGRGSLRWLAHILSFIVGAWLLGRLLDGGVGRGETAVFNLQAISDLLLILTAAALPFVVPAFGRYSRPTYLIAAHAGLLLWFWRELGSLDGGQGLVTVAWGIYAVALLIIALHYRLRLARLIALATLFVLVGKLFLVDLEALETIWRILLFAGVGGLFLLISYYYGAWLGLDSGADDQDETQSTENDTV